MNNYSCFTQCNLILPSSKDRFLEKQNMYNEKTLPVFIYYLLLLQFALLFFVNLLNKRLIYFRSLTINNKTINLLLIFLRWATITTNSMLEFKISFLFRFRSLTINNYTIELSLIVLKMRDYYNNQYD